MSPCALVSGTMLKMAIKSDNTIPVFMLYQ